MVREMPSHRIHCAQSLKRYGKDFTELHHWMDEMTTLVAYKSHRKFRHDPYKTPKVARRLFGEFADEACLDHIRLDALELKEEESAKAIINNPDHEIIRLSLQFTYPEYSVRTHATQRKTDIVFLPGMSVHIPKLVKINGKLQRDDANANYLTNEEQVRVLFALMKRLEPNLTDEDIQVIAKKLEETGTSFGEALVDFMYRWFKITAKRHIEVQI